MLVDLNIEWTNSAILQQIMHIKLWYGNLNASRHLGGNKIYM